MRTILALSAVSIFALTAGAQEVSTATVYKCAELTDDAARLACYDDAVGRLKVAEDAGDIATVTRQEVEEVQRDAFGFSLPSLPKLTMPKFGSNQSGRTDERGELQEIAQAVTSAKRNPLKKVIITLENGQVWQQTDSVSVYLSRRNPPTEATIKRGAIGSYFMKLDGGRAFRAKRLK